MHSIKYFIYLWRFISNAITEQNCDKEPQKVSKDTDRNLGWKWQPLRSFDIALAQYTTLNFIKPSF
jgi:hypothetical protein